MNYNNGKIYKITNNVNELQYVGSTYKELSERLFYHIVKSERFPNRKLYVAFNEIGTENFKIELIENYPCDNRTDLLNRECYWMKLLNTIESGYNQLRSKITEEDRKQWKKEYDERNKEYNIEYRASRKDIMKKYNQEYMEKNREKLLIQKKEYHEKNKDLLKPKKQQYYLDNVERIKEKNKERIYCEFCKIDILKCRKSTHEKTIFHQNAINNIITEKKMKTTICNICKSEYVKSSKARHEKSKKHQNAINNVIN